MAVITILEKIGLALLTSAFLILSFPNPDQGWLAWFALVPLILACRGRGFTVSVGLGLLSGMAAAFGIFNWMFELHGFQTHHALILAFYIGIYPALWCIGLSFFSRSRLPRVIIGPALWVAIDYLKAHAGFMAVPWATFAQSQHRNLALIQTATITGEYGITFLVVMGNIALAELITQRTWRSAIAVGLVICVVHVGGVIALSQPVPKRTLRVAVIQPCILIQERKTPEGRAATFERLERLSRDAAKQRPALIAWPETAVHDLPKDPLLMERVKGLAKDIDIPLVVGASEFVKFSIMGEGGEQLSVNERAYNSAYFITPNGPQEEPYRKVMLVPFGEYLPLEAFVRWPAWLVPRVFNDMPGDKLIRFKLKEDIWFTVRICWEGIFGDLLRPSVKEGAQLLVQINNANWFGRSAAEPQHNLASVFRAVENRIPVLVASNTGPSLIIDPYGRVLARLPDSFVAGMTTADVPLGNGLTFYTNFGDVFAFTCIACVILVLIVSCADIVRRKRG
ncbi:MAG: apolipoprotein N-acyltransferase [Desulfobacterales bacterium]|nr:apolipoprotein N-acyltransferase [Desulfobacterales bacterium]